MNWDSLLPILIGSCLPQTVCVQGSNTKYQALRLDVGNFSWGSECCKHKTRIIDVVNNVLNNEPVCTKVLAKNCIMLTDSTQYRQWYESHHALSLGHKTRAKLTPEGRRDFKQKAIRKKIQEKDEERKKNATISHFLEEQSQQGKLLARTAARPGQCGQAGGLCSRARSWSSI
ncbi:40S ribosomal protein S8-like [Sturnira hondurensis]|uniref:40S ribosomal protein S8-like n=1 Tax=Sturnira hondurensis TaxID=192404 RepID=UPI00187A6968|nr:40S ribosomal protein S8-like [Sturnira hondurensis]